MNPLPRIIVICWAFVIAGMLCLAQAQSIGGFPPGVFNNRAALDAVGAPPSGSGFSAHGTSNDLSTTSITNDTVTGNTTNWGTARGTQSQNSGLHYFEVKMLTASPAGLMLVGVMDNATATGAGMVDLAGNFANGVGIVPANGLALNTGTGYGSVSISSWTLADGNTMGVAIDLTNGFGYISSNNSGSCVYLNSGVPTSGGTGTGHVFTFSGSLTVFPVVTTNGIGSGQGQFQLITTNAAFACAMPSGYSEWGFLLDPANDNLPMWLEQTA
jgi:hypothetical protein